MRTFSPSNVLFWAKHRCSFKSTHLGRTPESDDNGDVDEDDDADVRAPHLTRNRRISVEVYCLDGETAFWLALSAE